MSCSLPSRPTGVVPLLQHFGLSGLTYLPIYPSQCTTQRWAAGLLLSLPARTRARVLSIFPIIFSSAIEPTWRALSTILLLFSDTWLCPYLAPTKRPFFQKHNLSAENLQSCKGFQTSSTFPTLQFSTHCFEKAGSRRVVNLRRHGPRSSAAQSLPTWSYL